MDAAVSEYYILLYVFFQFLKVNVSFVSAVCRELFKCCN